MLSTLIKVREDYWKTADERYVATPRPDGWIVWTGTIADGARRVGKVSTLAEAEGLIASDRKSS